MAECNLCGLLRALRFQAVIAQYAALVTIFRDTPLQFSQAAWRLPSWSTPLGPLRLPALSLDFNLVPNFVLGMPTSAAVAPAPPTMPLLPSSELQPPESPDAQLRRLLATPSARQQQLWKLGASGELLYQAPAAVH